jgi:hypothetical protein
MQKKLVCQILGLLFGSLILSGCSTFPLAVSDSKGIQNSASSSETAARSFESQARSLLKEGNHVAFGEQIASRLVVEPANPVLNFLNALNYHLQGGESNLSLARVGYKLAASQPVDLETASRASFMLGLLELERQQPQVAAHHLTRAVMDNPVNVDYQKALIGASLLAGDNATALAIAWSLRRSAVYDSQLWRNTVLSTVGLSSEQGAQILKQFRVEGLVPEFEQNALKRRAELVELAQFDAFTDNSSSAPKFVPGQSTNQMGVEVTLILSDDRKGSSYGLNLLDGLSLQYSAERVFSSTRDGILNQQQTQITRSVRIPEINYNLNLFNRSDRWYEVVARPSITAIEGTTSKFFVGEQIIVQTSGVNVTSIESLDIGVGLQLTPQQIREDGAVLSIQAERSFFSDQTVGTFIQQLPTFKQRVEATADVKFGESLVLSGLSERVRDGNKSRTPGLGDIPGVDLLFSRSSNLERTRSVIVLITPLSALSVPTTDKTAVNRQALIDFLMRKNLTESSMLETIEALKNFSPGKQRIKAEEVGFGAKQVRKQVVESAMNLLGDF